MANLERGQGLECSIGIVIRVGSRGGQEGYRRGALASLSEKNVRPVGELLTQ